MNYRHIYHAGNFADIFKHIILTICLEKFHEKPAPFFVLDTHAGIGKYDLDDEKSLKTFEASDGIRKIFSVKNFSYFLPQSYLKILAKINCCEVAELPQKLKIYAGSPIITKYFLRPQDRAIFAELNREDFFQLKRNFAGNKKVTTLNEDGFHLLKSKLPPIEKRGLILIDPAFEKDQSKISEDYLLIIENLAEAYKRFAHGTYIIWHPIIRGEENFLEKFYQKISALKFQKIIHAVFDIGMLQQADYDTKMTSCGAFIINAPWQLEERLNFILPKILEILKKSDSAKFEIKINNS